MGHIHTTPGQVDQTVSAYIVRRDGDEVYVMLHKHKKLGKLLPIGGHVELHETPWGAMSHELTEESGYNLDDLRILQPKTRIMQLENVVLHPQPIVVQTHSVAKGHFHTDMGYLFVAETLPPAAPAEGESEDIRWLTRDGVESLSNDEIWDNTRQICRVIFDEFLEVWQPIDTHMFLTAKPVE